MIKLAKYFDSKLICFIDAQDRNAVLCSMIDLAFSHSYIIDKDAFYSAIIEREKIVSTGIGMGVAIPHAKLSAYNDFFVVVGVLKKGVDWNGLDGHPVRLVFMIGGPDDKQTEYLQILSSLTFAIKDEDKRKKILTSNSADDILNLFKDF